MNYIIIMPLEWKLKLDWKKETKSYGYNWSEPVLTEIDMIVDYIDPNYDLNLFNKYCDKDGNIDSNGFNIITKDMKLKSVDVTRMEIATLTLKKATLIEKESDVLEKFLSDKHTVLKN